MYSVDFETTSTENYKKDNFVGVWAVAVTNIKTLKRELLANNVNDLFKWCGVGKSKTLFFHNLKFDGTFLLYYLFRNGYKYNSDKKINKGEFNTLIDGVGEWYKIYICLKTDTKHKIFLTIYDSYKLLPFSAEKLANDFNCTIKKGSIDYTKYRDIKNYEIKEKEKDYIYNDTEILAECLNELKQQGLNKMTIGGCALDYFKQTLNGGFNYLFPILSPEIDNDIRQSYKGGFVYVNPKYQNMILENNISYDVNSLYPYVMYSKPMPYGVPKYYKGKYKNDTHYPLYIQRVLINCRLKKEHIPTLQIKNNFRFCPTEYLRNTQNELIDLTLTSVDLDLLLKHYDILEIQYINGYKFKAVDGLFKDYIEFWINVKNSNVGAKRAIAKLMLNSLYGKFGTNPKKQNIIPFYNCENDIIEYKTQPIYYDKPIYTALACFVTAFAREKTITTAQKVFDRFIYADTDSIHLVGTEPPKIDIDNKILGAWKYEGKAEKAKFIRPKTYIKSINGKTVVTCAGMPSETKEQVNFDNFNIGTTFTGKLQAKKVRGGTLLQNTTFTIN